MDYLYLGANLIGMLGTTLIVVSYFLLQLDKLNPKGLSYNLMNLFGSSFLLLSLLVHFNLASFVIEVFWIAASLVGLWQVIKKNHATKPHNKTQKR